MCVRYGPPQPHRVLITGSREWPKHVSFIVDGILNGEWLNASLHDTSLVVVHGNCPSGADSDANRWAQLWQNKYMDHAPVTNEPHPANWSRQCDQDCRHATRMRDGQPYCPMAGHLRNQEMVDAGADICHAFIVEGAGRSRGTRDCVTRARAAGIPVMEHRWSPL